MENKIKELRKLGANIEILPNGLKLIGNWISHYNQYHHLFVEITGELYTSHTEQDKDFLRNLTTLGELYTYHTEQDKDFLRNLTTLGELDTYNTEQNKDFLRNLTTLGNLYTYNTEQNKDFLRNLTTLGELYTSHTEQNKDFLRNLTTLGNLYTHNTEQNKDFLRNLTTLGNLYTYNTEQNKDFLRNLTTLGELYTYNAKQDKDFLRNLTTLGELYTYNAKQNKDFLRNLTTLGNLYTSHTEQDKEFLRDSTQNFKLPFIYLDGILSKVQSKRKNDNIIIYLTNRIGYTNKEYVVSEGTYHAHAKSLKMALIDLRFKKSKRDTSWLDNKTLDSVLSFEDSILAYRCITGACSGGVENFLLKTTTQDNYSIKEIIELTKGYYRNNDFKNFFRI